MLSRAINLLSVSQANIFPSPSINQNFTFFIHLSQCLLLKRCLCFTFSSVITGLSFIGEDFISDVRKFPLYNHNRKAYLLKFPDYFVVLRNNKREHKCRINCKNYHSFIHLIGLMRCFSQLFGWRTMS